MLPKKHRIKNNIEFDKVKKKGKMYSADCFGLLVLKNTGDFKSGIIVSKKVFSKAVYRNKAKRAINRVLRELLEEVEDNFIVVFLVRKNINEKDDKELKEEILKVFKKAEIIK